MPLVSVFSGKVAGCGGGGDSFRCDALRTQENVKESACSVGNHLRRELLKSQYNPGVQGTLLNEPKI
jgi:hypothetical protein